MWRLFFLVLLPTLVQADADLCTFGWDHNVHAWLSDSRAIPAVFCGKNAKAKARTLMGKLKARLDHDGYHLTEPLSVQEIAIGDQMSYQLRAAMVQEKCSVRTTRIFTVCLSLKETQPFFFRDGKRVDPKALPEPGPPVKKASEGITPIY